MIDGEPHTRRRTLVAPAFTGPAAAALESRVAAICRDKAAAFLGRAEADLVREYAMPIPILVICDALGLPMDRVEEVSRGADSMVGAGATREEAYSLQLAGSPDDLDLSTSMVILRGLKSLPVRFRTRDA